MGTRKSCDLCVEDATHIVVCQGGGYVCSNCAELVELFGLKAVSPETAPGIEDCPGCGSQPGDGITKWCSHPVGCGYWREVGAQ